MKTMPYANKEARRQAYVKNREVYLAQGRVWAIKNRENGEGK